MPRPDARVPDLSCATQQYPEVVPDPVIYGGDVYEPGLTGTNADEPVEAAVFRARARDGAAVLATATSTADGRFALTLPTGGQPLDTYFDVSHSLYLATKVFLPTFVFEPRDDLHVALFKQSHVDALEGFAGWSTGDEEGLLIVRAFDCQGVPLEGVTITSEPAPITELYMTAQGLPDYNLTATTANGAVALFGLPRGPTILRGEIHGQPMRETSILVARFAGGTVTSAGIVP